MGVGLAPLWLQRILNETLGWWPTTALWLGPDLSTVASGGQWHGAFVAGDTGSCLCLTLGLQPNLL